VATGAADISFATGICLRRLQAMGIGDRPIPPPPWQNGLRSASSDRSGGIALSMS
jgi:hypothetical protein